MNIVKVGDRIILKLDNEEGLLYLVMGDLIKPFELVETLSKSEVKDYETETKAH